MSDKKIASLPTHTRHQSVSGPYPVLAAHPAENHRWVRPRGQPGTTERGSLIKRPASRPSRRAPKQNVYGASNPAAAGGNRPAAPPLRSRGLGLVRTEPDDHAERAARPESRRPPAPTRHPNLNPARNHPLPPAHKSGRTLPATALAPRAAGQHRTRLWSRRRRPPIPGSRTPGTRDVRTQNGAGPCHAATLDGAGQAQREDAGSAAGMGAMEC